MLNYLPHFDSFARPPLESKALGGKISLNKNEAPFSPQDIVPDIDFDLGPAPFNVYPDAFPLYEALANFLGCARENLLFTCGSEQAIRQAFEVMVGPGDEVVYMNPSFAMIDVFASQFRAKKSIVPFNDQLQCPVADILATITRQTKLVVLPNPNNPTGSILSNEELERIAVKCAPSGTMLLVDEAYYHYYPQSAVQLVQKYEHVIITRTFSKAWGLAGTRVGYVVAQPQTINLLRKVKPIDEVSTPAIHQCLQVLRHPEILTRNVGQVQNWKSTFARLTGPHVFHVPSEGNFILLKCSPQAHEKCSAWFLENDMLIHYQMPFPALRHHLRLSVGKDACMKKIMAQLQGCNAGL